MTQQMFWNTLQWSLVLQYVMIEEIFEHIWGLFIPENETADGILKHILEQ